MSHTATTQFSDATLMPFGMHRGKAMVNIPAKYLFYLYDKGCSHAGVKQYILNNLDALRKEAENVRRK